MPEQNGRWHPEELFQVQPNQDFNFPILIVGGSTAAYAAALSALQTGAILCWVIPNRVLGGQYTAQALPASDDSPLMAPEGLLGDRYRDPRRLSNGELFGISRSQRRFRERQRQLQPVNGATLTNPGGGWVSHFAVTPATAAKALNEPLFPYLDSGHLTLIGDSDPVEVLSRQELGSSRTMTGVVFNHRSGNVRFTVNAGIVIEGTDLGDLLALGNFDSRVGQEARSETQEAVLPEVARPDCQQAFTYGIVVERSQRSNGIGAPAGYDRDPWLQSQEFTGTYWSSTRGWGFYEAYGMFRYRRLSRDYNDNLIDPGNLSVLNWGVSPLSQNGPSGCGNDFKHGVLVGNSLSDRQEILRRGRDRARAYLHFLQTQVSSNLVGRGDMTWTADGIALEPYIRESRRGIAMTTIRHEDVASKFFPNAARAKSFSDSIGIGHYHYLDFHPNNAPGHVDLADGHDCSPFTIPLGALIPIATDGLVLSAKNIGTTHITNAAYRMHPVEWAIGEAGGALAAFAAREGVTVRDVAKDDRLLRKFQGRLAARGVPLFWFNDVSHEDPDFEAIQVLAAAGIVRTENNGNLNFNPEGTVNRAVVAVALVNVLGLPLITPEIPSFVDVPRSHFAYSSIETLKARGIVSGVGDQRFAPSSQITREQFAILMANVNAGALVQLFTDTPRDASLLRRRELSRTLYRLLQSQ